ncbi:tyrosine-type recombinase/integrase [Arthrobacter cavernae]|uniref:Tyrosine-type recombinase/integrase n=1 Tax=Arthrobacter cavernae TaxID=2817681 RepID=A0A939KQ33_9MICC|nr:tyrosine-type recombinase/integrase [Arthrobacter cavernae]MBO1269595.1 tyrosine-type recombinase/integrase [Arthrobacter cavernae]
MAKVTRRCGCRDETGKQYGASCPKLKNYRHGTWGFRLSAGFDPISGKRRYLTDYSYTSSGDAEEAMREAEKQLRGQVYDFKKTTAAAYINEWLEAQERHSQLKPSTLRMYKSYVAKDIVPAFGAKLLLRDLRRAHVAGLVKGLQDAGRGAVTIKRIHATLSSALTDAVQDGLLAENVAAGARLPKVDKKKIQVWEPSDAGRFLDAATEHRMGALFEVAILSGMRRGELCGLRWQDVDLPNRRMVVRVQLVQVGNKVVEGTIKTDAGQDRVVALSDRAVAALIAWQFQQEQERHAWADAYTESGRVFTYEDGRQLRPGYVSKLFELMVAKLGLPMMRLHDLRHLHASLMLASGQDLAIVSKSMGHSNSQITRDLYAHMVGDAARNAVEGAASLLPARRTVLTSVITGQ